MLEDNFLEMLVSNGGDFDKTVSDYHASRLAEQRRYEATQRIIKAAVQAIEDVVESDCTYFTKKHLKPHLEALKGLIDD